MSGGLPLVSAIIPAFNSEAHLGGAIASIRQQGYEALEILVVDDGSTDGTAALAEAMGTRVIRQANQGPAAARNTGLREAAGEYIAFLDADDEWPEDKLSIQMARLYAEPELDAVLGRIAYRSRNGAALPDYIYEGPDHTITHVHLGSGVYRRRAFERVGLFDASLRYCEDIDWFLRARETGLSMRILRAVTLDYFVHGGNMTTDRSLPDSVLSLALKKSLDRRRAAGTLTRPLRRWLDYDECADGVKALVSVVIPAYNAARFLREAVESVLGQTYAPLEILIVDDGSTDGTLEVARQFAPRARVFASANKGAAAARNLGVRHATGKYLAFLDADDYWSRERIALQMEALGDDAGEHMVYGHALQFGSAAAPPDAMPGYVPGTLLIAREAFLKAGPLREDLKVGEFIDWYARAKHLGYRETVIPQTVLHRRIHGDNLGVRERQSRTDYLRVLKAAMDRKRQTQEPRQ